MTRPTTQAPDAALPLRAVRRRLPTRTAVDPFPAAGPSDIVFDDGDQALSGRGAALVLPLRSGREHPEDLAHAQRTLAAIACDDELGDPARAVRAFGALPFDQTHPGRLVVPAVLFGRDRHGAWVTAVDTDPEGALATVLACLDGPSATEETTLTTERADREPSGSTGPEIVPATSDEHFRNAVGAALAALESGALSKVVLARQVDLHLAAPVDVVALLARWRVLEPDCTLFSVPTDEGQFVGASPELLVRRAGAHIYSRPLAGTRARDADQDGVALQASPKDAAEHRFVTDAITEILAPLCIHLDVPANPEPVRLRNIVHLGTAIHGILRSPADPVSSVLDLVALLHPTPAVGGVPRQRALELIATLEPDQRGSYAGPVGYVDAGGDGTWVVGIRAALLCGTTARLAAGVGIVLGSDPEAELAETELKLAAVLDAIVDDPAHPVGAGGHRRFRSVRTG